MHQNSAFICKKTPQYSEAFTNREILVNSYKNIEIRLDELPYAKHQSLLV